MAANAISSWPLPPTATAATPEPSQHYNAGRSVDTGEQLMQVGPTIVISIDAELVWGFHDKDEVPTERVGRARQSWLDSVALFDEYDVATTWAIVGHLFLEECSGDHATHPAGEEWFSRDPGGAHTPDSRWFGRGLIDAVVESDVDHEIASHTFSHVVFDAPETTPEVAAAELEYSCEAAAEYGIDLDSFVYPRNYVDHRDLLAEYGFECYRGVAPDRWYDATPVRRAGKFATYALGATAPPIVTPEVDEYGLVNVPASMYLFALDGAPRDALERVAQDPVVRQVRLGLERLADEGEGVLHLWFHPNNVTTERDLARLREVVATISDHRDRHGVDVETMARVADQVRGRADV